MQLTVALIIKIFLGVLGTFFISLFFWFLNSFKKSLRNIDNKIDKVQKNFQEKLKSTQKQVNQKIKNLSQKLDDLKQRYFEDLAGFGKIFVFQQTFNKSQDRILKKVQKLEAKYENFIRRQ